MPPKTDESQNIKITKLEVTMINLQNGLDDIKSEFDKFDNKNDEAHKDIMKKIDAFIDTADKKYASKQVETAMWWLIFAVGVSIIGIIAKVIAK